MIGVKVKLCFHLAEASKVLLGVEAVEEVEKGSLF